MADADTGERSAAAVPRPPAMSDVAKLAGVSHQTVSRVLNDHPNVKAATRERVQQAIAELGYRRNEAARALVTRRTGAIGVITEDSPLFGPTMTLIAVENAARSQGTYVSVATVTRWEVDSVQATLEHFLDQGVDGVVVIASHDEAVRAVKDYSRKLPVVMVGPGQVSGHIHTVAVDQYAGASLAVGHLLDLGHRDVLHVRGPSVWLDARARERGWQDALLQAGVRPGEPVPGDWTASAGFAIGRSLLGRRDEVPLPTAVFTANDQLALGLLHAFADAGVNVPREVSVVGFDDVEGSEHFFPPLTTVRPDWAALGRRCLERMAAAIERQPAQGVLVGARLVVRASSAAPRA